LVLVSPLSGVAPERDFSGSWVLDAVASSVGAIPKPVDASLRVVQDDAAIRCTAGSNRWSYELDGRESRVRIGGESRNSIAKWEGVALLINTLVSGPQSYTVMDRWVLSRDRATLTITRQVVRAGGQVEGTLVYRRPDAVPSRAVAAAPPASPAPPSTSPPAPAPQPVLARKPEPALPPDITVPVGTRVLLELVSEVSTKHAKEGDHVYLRTAVPVAANGRVVIPRGSDVNGTITRTKPAGKVAGKGELYIRFDSLILPNGVSRDFRARPSGDEGKVQGNGKSADPRAVMAGAGMGATIGGITRGLPGAGIGGVAGGLAGVLLSRNQDIVLRPGAQVEMVLDRDLVFHPEEIR